MLSITFLFKNRKKVFLLTYDIYGFAINRIYQKLSNMYISVFRWGHGCREIIFHRWEQKPLQVTVGKNIALWYRNGGIQAAKRCFSRGLAWSRRHQFLKMRNFDQSWTLPAMFFDNVSFLRKTMARVRGNCCCHQPWSTSRDLVHINRHQIGRYMSYLRNFNRPLGLPGNRWRCFWCRQCVISLKNDGASPWQLPLPSVVEHVATVLISQFCGTSTILHFISRSCILHNTDIHHQKW